MAGVLLQRGDGSEHRPLLSEEAARAAAEESLIDAVGDLLLVEEGTLEEADSPRWIFSVALGNARRGRLGAIGSVSVDARSGEVLFSEEARLQLIENAERLARSPSPSAATTTE
jgi:hypothetical protein